jgi:hypothetical protein
MRRKILERPERRKKDSRGKKDNTQKASRKKET